MSTNLETSPSLSPLSNTGFSDLIDPKALHRLTEAILASEPAKPVSVLEIGMSEAASVENLPETPFDAATLILVLHFLPDDGAKLDLLCAISDRLKPGAPFILVSLFGDRETTRYKKIMALTKQWALAGGLESAQTEELLNPARPDLFPVPEDRLKNLLRDAGFIDVQRVYQVFAIGAWFARKMR